ncbi:MAG: PAS domain S-box protein [Polyangia bacterium]|jgi:PAS domain S-box-containing protein|nr:PAS domain S-box protein [Polyangia bacterium]
MSEQTEEFIKRAVDLEELIRERKRVEEALRESEEKYRILVDHSLQGLIIAQGWPARLVFANRAFALFLGREPEELLTLPPEALEGLVHSEDREAFFEDYRAHLAGLAAPNRRTFRVVRADGKLCWIEAYISVTRVQGEIAVQAAVMDVTERREAELERERLIEELNAALREIRTLRGIVPICASCKKVRDDHGFWQQVETYVSVHSHAEFSHSICPECVRRLYPEYAPQLEAEGEVEPPSGDASSRGDGAHGE